MIKSIIHIDYKKALAAYSEINVQINDQIVIENRPDLFKVVLIQHQMREESNCAVDYVVKHIFLETMNADYKE